MAIRNILTKDLYNGDKSIFVVIACLITILVTIFYSGVITHNNNGNLHKTDFIIKPDINVCQFREIRQWDLINAELCYYKNWQQTLTLQFSNGTKIAAWSYQTLKEIRVMFYHCFVKEALCRVPTNSIKQRRISGCYFEVYLGDYISLCFNSKNNIIYAHISNYKVNPSVVKYLHELIMW